MGRASKIKKRVESACNLLGAANQVWELWSMIPTRLSCPRSWRERLHHWLWTPSFAGLLLVRDGLLKATISSTMVSLRASISSLRVPSSWSSSEWRVEDDRQLRQSLHHPNCVAEVTEYKDSWPAFKQQEEGRDQGDKLGESGDKQEVQVSSFPAHGYSRMDEEGEEGQDQSHYYIGNQEDDQSIRTKIQAEQGICFAQQTCDWQPLICRHSCQSHANYAGNSGSLGSLHDAGFIMYWLQYTYILVLVIWKTDVNKVNYATYFPDKLEDIFNAMHIHLQPSLKCIENIFNSTVTWPIWGPKDNLMPTLGFQV